MRKVMMVVAVLITSCHVSTSENSQKDGAHTTTSTTHATKNGARLTKPADASAKRSNSFAFCSAMFSPRLTFALPRSRVALFVELRLRFQELLSCGWPHSGGVQPGRS